jgi:hypothetical protein
MTAVQTKSAAAGAATGTSGPRSRALPPSGWSRFAAGGSGRVLDERAESTYDRRGSPAFRLQDRLMQRFVSCLLVVGLSTAVLGSCRSSPRTGVSIDPLRGRLALQPAVDAMPSAAPTPQRASAGESLQPAP